MPKGAAKQAQGQFGKANKLEDTYGGRGDQAWNSVFPELKNDITNPKGFTDQQKANMTTANSQAAGGAGIVGQANLAAGRTRNQGGFGAALAEAARSGQRTQADNALKIQNADANLAQQKQQRAMGALQDLYGTNVGAANNMFKNANDSLNTWIKADEATQNALMGDIGMGMKAATLGMTGAGMPGFSMQGSA